MPRATLTFRVDDKTRESLDQIAASLDRDRSHIINEALRNYIDVHHWHTAHITEGLRQADAGEFASPAAVKRTIARLRRK